MEYKWTCFCFDFKYLLVGKKIKCFESVEFFTVRWQGGEAGCLAKMKVWQKWGDKYLGEGTPVCVINLKENPKLGK